MPWSNQPKYIVKEQCYLTVGKNNTVSAWMTSLTSFSTDKPTVWTLSSQKVPSGIPLPPELKPPSRPKTQLGSVPAPQGNKSVFYFLKRNPFFCCCYSDVLLQAPQQFFFIESLTLWLHFCMTNLHKVCTFGTLGIWIYKWIEIVLKEAVVEAPNWWFLLPLSALSRVTRS